MPIIGMDTVLAAIEEKKDEIMEACAKGVALGLEVIVGTAKEKAPVDTGELRDKITAMTFASNTGVDGHVIAFAEHAPYIEFGTGPRGQASEGAPAGMAYRQTGWYAPIKGGVRYIEGYPARPFLYPALEEEKDEVREQVMDAVKKVIG